MGVAVDETRHHDAAGGADLDRVAGSRKVLDAAAGAGFDNGSVAHQESSIANDAEFRQCGAAARAGRSAQGEQLPGGPNQKGRNLFLPTHTLSLAARPARMG